MNLYDLYTIIMDRKMEPKSGSYTTSLIESGLSRMAQKVGEEGTEVVIAALAREKQELVEEIADLAFHTLVLMAAKGVTPDDINLELSKRHK